MDNAEIIKQTLSMRDVADRYGMEINRAGFTACPFHSGDHTPSLKIYDEPGRGFFCYGCNRGGDVIKFVQMLFGITFPQALQRLKSDFLIRGCSDPREEFEWQKRKRREKKAREKREQEAIKNASEHARIIETIKTATPMSDEWAKAVRDEIYYGYLMEDYLYG